MFARNNDFMRPLWHNGPTPGGLYNFPGHNGAQEIGGQAKGDYGSQRSSQPITTGTSVVGMKFDGGVIIAADNLVSYGSMARFQDVTRVFNINNKTVIGAGGDFADFQCIKRYIDQKIVDDICSEDEYEMKPKSLYNWLTRILYTKRSKFEPLWIDMVVGGMEADVPFLGHIDLRGRSYQDDVIATGFGKHLALPLLRERLDTGKPLQKDEAIALMKKCMEVLFYRDCRASPNFTVTICTKDKAEILGPFRVAQNWELAKAVEGY